MYAIFQLTMIILLFNEKEANKWEQKFKQYDVNPTTLINSLPQVGMK